jgi:hypothetical protein
MAEQKSRGGKKPKYQIADIGGSDLTPQDLSTERVLNFLIKGEAPAESGAGTAADGLKQTGPSREQTVAGAGEEPADTSLPSPTPQGKKSLDHLFRRANSSGAAAKDLKLNLPDREEPTHAAEAGDAKPAERAQPAPSAVQAEGELGFVTRPPQPDAAEDRHTPTDPQVTPPSGSDVRPQTVELQKLMPEVSAATPEDSAEFTQLISLWKSFYRLKDGEIDALRAMYRMSHGRGSDECHVKMHKLAEMSDLTYRYCQKVVRSLEQLGWITKIKDYDPTTQLGVLYRINLKPSV